MPAFAENGKKDILAKYTRISHLIIVCANFVVLFVAYNLAGKSKSVPDVSGRVIIKILYILAILCLPVIHYFKRYRLARLPRSNGGREPEKKALWNLNVLIVTMCGTIAMFGLIGAFLGKAHDYALLFVGLSLLAHLLFHLRPKDLRAK
jgi:hypothetical protein